MERTLVAQPVIAPRRSIEDAHRHYTDVRVGMKLGTGVQYLIALPQGGYCEGLEVRPTHMELAAASDTSVVLRAPAKSGTFVLRRSEGFFYGTFIDGEGLTYRGFSLGDRNSVLTWLRGIGAPQLADADATIEQFMAVVPTH